MIYTIGYLIFAVWYKIFNFYTIKNKENIPDGAAILCANHTTWSDPLFVAFALGIHARPLFMSKIQIVSGKPFSKILTFILERVGVFFVDREHATIGAIRKSMKGLRVQKKLVLFPEGTRVRKGKSVTPKGGANMLSYSSGAPIVPIYITPGHKFPFKKTEVIIGKPILYNYTSKPTQNDFEEKAKDLMDQIFKLGEEK